MAIVPLRHVTLIGELKRRDAVIANLQRLGCVHVVDLSSRADASPGDTSHHDDLKAAIAYLQRCPEQCPATTQTASDAALKEIAAEVLQIQTDSRLLAEEQELVLENVERTRPWGDFQVPSPSELGGRQLFFYRLTHTQARSLTDDPVDLQTFSVIRRDRRFEYWVVVAEQPPAEMPVAPEQLDPRPLAVLQQRLSELRQKQEDLQLRRIGLTRWLDQMHRRSTVIQDATARMIAIQRCLIDGPLFVLQGWLPQRKLGELEPFALQQSLALHSRVPSADEQPPTLLTNPRPIAGAEGAVTFFITPSYRAWDPTWVMFASFSFFFAMILADAGYGLVLAVILAILAKSLGRTDSGRRFRQLAIVVVLVTIVYGALIGSYFGFSPPVGSFLDRWVIKSGGRSIMQNSHVMMLVAATIGIFHLMLANVIVAWRWLGSAHALASVGWAITLLGGWLLALAKIPQPDVMTWASRRVGDDPAALTAWVSSCGWWLLGTGFVMVFLFSSTRALFSLRPYDWLMRMVDGVLGLTGISKAFGDTLSYLRLFALGLASAQLAITFNDLAASASTVRGVGVLLGLLIFLLGHALNLLLAVVGGVVHGLRLNCIEFFSWSLTDEGQPFEALKMRKAND